MARAPFQVLVLPFFQLHGSEPIYAVLRRRAIPAMWQVISGGGEGSETPHEAAVRETREETGIACPISWIRLDAQASIPVSSFKDTAHWPPDLFVIPEYAFGVAVPDTAIQLSSEHSEFVWLPFEQAYRRLTWHGNQVALWELHCRVCKLSPAETANPALADLMRG